MDSAKLGKNLLLAGLAFLGIAVVWWLVALDGESIECIAGLGIECKVVNMLTGYSPAPFWIGVVLAVIGAVIRRSGKTAS